ncbi:putative aspergillopepsin-2 precursor [Lophiostoma macrostomum CBS 122681]|uniref:Putative aspergillopepsin-2 n=1 Tax=Lophiostoma macrostomum CBS 122681 TaxID=1314788 RepID=A0A6A6SK73_9PLEO|nr:putative aspergillopepsin-2 precursor [Lophiostoma macrostomum CBS 122681]
MKITLLATLLIAVTSAAPNRLAARVASRSARLRNSQPLARLDLVDEQEFTEDGNNTAHVQYSSNWSGAVLESPPSGTTFNSAHGRFTVPTPKFVGSGSATESSSAWVGIDGDTYGNAILQAGVDFTVTSSGAVSYDTWYEWYPDYAYDFTGFSVKAGDVIQVDIVATTTSKGTVTITNETTGKSVSKTLSAPSSSAKLGGQNAEWIVEDFEENGSLVPLSNFGTVVFTGASAGTVSGTTVGLSGATVIDIKQGSTVYTDVTINSASQVTVKYV